MLVNIVNQNTGCCAGSSRIAVILGNTGPSGTAELGPSLGAAEAGTTCTVGLPPKEVFNLSSLLVQLRRPLTSFDSLRRWKVLIEAAECPKCLGSLTPWWVRNCGITELKAMSTHAIMKVSITSFRVVNRTVTKTRVQEVSMTPIKVATQFLRNTLW